MPWGRGFLYCECWIKLNNISLANVVFQGANRSNNENYLDVGPVLPLQGWFFLNCVLSVFKGTAYLRGNLGIVWVKLPQIQESLLRISCFSQRGISQIASNPWLISRVLKKSFDSVFANVLVAFKEEIIWYESGPHSTSLLTSAPLNGDFKFPKAYYDFLQNILNNDYMLELVFWDTETELERFVCVYCCCSVTKLCPILCDSHEL